MTTDESSRWAKSSYSDNGGNCLEWVPQHASVAGEFMIRDSKDPEGPVLSFPAASFTGFIAGIKADEFPTL
ncbi:DUF397 domain-containing protein [Streptomyces sp. 21So2-11]|uniref:DUF397 domain-containing protein n=1 Tax=Streptomyces sp. 21So2-11 TaxID=3144408 RepID=UPI003219FA87